MDKNAIKKFAVWARTELIARVSLKGVEYGITENNIEDANADSVGGKVLTVDEKKQRQALIAEINDKGYKQVMEEVAYTWFNRFSALRFMEVNGYLPSHVRVFTDEENNFKPQIITEAIHLDMDGLNMEKVYELKDAEKTEELYKYLLIVQCNALNTILPGMFQKLSDYTELLLPDNLLREGSVIQQMIEQIQEEDWKDAVQIIGWLYQYYNAELKAQADNAVKQGGKITGENLPEKTQIFTPDWIVRYMVENSLGRLWVEGHPNEELKVNWKYYLEEAEQEPDVQAQLAEIRKEYAALTPDQLKVIDPCSGSGHILAYMFDVLMQIYESYGYTTREAVASIVENNLYGLDIDDRAAQLAYFAVMMKARQYDRRFFSRGIQPHVYAIAGSNHVDQFALEYFCDGDAKLKKAMDTIICELHDAKEYGSILTVTQHDWSVLYDRFAEITEDINMSREATLRELLPLVQTAQALAQKYDTVVTNPPYLGLRSIGAKTLEYIQTNYPDSKNDFFAVFIDKCIKLTKACGKTALVTAESWLSLSSFEKIRLSVLETTTINNMLHLGNGAFDAGFGTVAFSLTKQFISEYCGIYYKLNDIEDPMSKENAVIERNAAVQYFSRQSDFSYIPGAAVSYWVSQRLFDCFTRYTPLGDIAEPRQGLTTCDNDRFMRFWHEVCFNNIAFQCSSTDESEFLPQKWYPYNKGGEPRKWYGNNEYIVNWHNDGAEIKTYVASKYVSYSRTVKNIPYYFRKGLTWSAIAKKYAVRAYGNGFIFADKGQAVFVDDKSYYYICGLMNSKFTDSVLAIISPTLDFNCGYIKKIPVCLNESKYEVVAPLVIDSIQLSQYDWDAFETSWDFQHHPLLRKVSTVAEAFDQWQAECDNRFNQLKANEEELNRIFVDIYGLQDELTPEVEDKDVTVRKADLGRDIRSFISYAVGCMFGRYSIYEDRLIYAGGDWNEKFSSYNGTYGDLSQYTHTELGKFKNSELKEKFYYLKNENKKALFCYKVDYDNIIPICNDEYFTDDIVGRFVEFIRIVYGEDTLDENLKFIADALGGKGQPKDVIRNYFLNDFYSDHCKIYQKRPIYWLFDSGKKNGFKALIYMHRYQPDTIARIRTDYVHEQQARYRTAIADLEQRIADASTGERVKLNKKLTALRAQDDEIRIYEEKIHHLADQMISIDLDDGVKKNYAIFQDVLAKIK